jgi:hypothetical protein
MSPPGRLQAPDPVMSPSLACGSTRRRLGSSGAPPTAIAITGTPAAEASISKRALDG